MKDLIIAATTRYTKEQLYNYVESINRCGFSGDKIMVVYDVDDDTIDFCQRVTEALSNGWKLHGEPKMIFDHKRKIMRCGQAVIKQSSKKYKKDMDLNKI